MGSRQFTGNEKVPITTLERLVHCGTRMEGIPSKPIQRNAWEYLPIRGSGPGRFRLRVVMNQEILPIELIGQRQSSLLEMTQWVGFVLPIDR